MHVIQPCVAQEIGFDFLLNPHLRNMDAKRQRRQRLADAISVKGISIDGLTEALDALRQLGSTDFSRREMLSAYHHRFHEVGRMAILEIDDDPTGFKWEYADPSELLRVTLEALTINNYILTRCRRIRTLPNHHGTCALHMMNSYLAIS